MRPQGALSLEFMGLVDDQRAGPLAQNLPFACLLIVQEHPFRLGCNVHALEHLDLLFRVDCQNLTLPLVADRLRNDQDYQFALMLEFDRIRSEDRLSRLAHAHVICVKGTRSRGHENGPGHLIVVRGPLRNASQHIGLGESRFRDPFDCWHNDAVIAFAFRVLTGREVVLERRERDWCRTKARQQVYVLKGEGARMDQNVLLVITRLALERRHQHR